jgi:hypothetical protein
VELCLCQPAAIVVDEPTDDGGDTMFLAQCNRCGRRELRGPRGVTGLANTASGIEIGFRCTGCGARQRMHTGAQAGLPLLRAG